MCRLESRYWCSQKFMDLFSLQGCTLEDHVWGYPPWKNFCPLRHSHLSSTTDRPDNTTSFPDAWACSHGHRTSHAGLLRAVPGCLASFPVELAATISFCHSRPSWCTNLLYGWGSQHPPWSRHHSGIGTLAHRMAWWSISSTIGASFKCAPTLPRCLHPTP